MKKPAFSVVVPVYKVENYLDKCVQSIINQTYSNIQIVLVDDGGEDNCPALCDEYAAKDNRITVIHKPNGGLSDARNAGTAAAEGKYIIFVDSDDYIETDTCEKLLPYTEENYDIIVGDGVSFGAKKKLAHDFDIAACSGKEYLKYALGQNSMPMAAWLYVYRRAFLEDNNLEFKYGIAHEDDHFTPRAFLAAEKVVNTKVCFYNYVIRENSITTKKDLRKNARDLYNTCIELLDIYSTIEDEDLRNSLTDALVMKYLSLYQTGKLYQYGKDFIHKKFVWKNAYKSKTKMKAGLFCISPRLYWHINNISKKF